MNIEKQRKITKTMIDMILLVFEYNMESFTQCQCIGDGSSLKAFYYCSMKYHFKHTHQATHVYLNLLRMLTFFDRSS